MRQTKQGNLLDHEYDGIQEFDNPTPGWWHGIFWLTILCSFLYVNFWHYSDFSWSVHDSLSAEQTAYYEKLFGEIGELEPTEETLMALQNEPKWLKVGQAVYQGNCTACHGPDGGGINGPNLADERWINVKKLGDVYTTITNGVVIKGMPAWQNRLNDNQRIVVAAYVASLRGTKPKSPREGEGEPVAPWPKVEHGLPTKDGAAKQAANESRFDERG